jgi:hypothetical protein
MDKYTLPKDSFSVCSHNSMSDKIYNSIYYHFAIIRKKNICAHYIRKRI